MTPTMVNTPIGSVKMSSNSTKTAETQFPNLPAITMLLPSIMLNQYTHQMGMTKPKFNQST